MATEVKYNLPSTHQMIGKLTRYQELFLIADKTEGEQSEFNQLSLDLSQYMITASDFNGKLDADGVALSAEKWENTRKITLSGDASGNVNIDGSQNATLNVSIDGLASKLNKSGGTMTGALVAQSNTQYSTRQVRNIILSPNDPDINSMQNGDIWAKYMIGG